MTIEINWSVHSPKVIIHATIAKIIKLANSLQVIPLFFLLSSKTLIGNDTVKQKEKKTPFVCVLVEK